MSSTRHRSVLSPWPEPERAQPTVTGRQPLRRALGWLIVLVFLAGVSWYVWVSYEFGQAMRNLPG